MRFLPWWRGRRSSGLAGNRLARFRKVLEVAKSLPVYEASLRSAKLDATKALKRITDVEAALSRLGVFSLEQVRVRPSRRAATPVVVTSPLATASKPELYWNSAGCAVLKEESGSRGVRRSLLIRIGVEEGLLSAVERDGLWQRHGLPMFEHLYGMDGALLAWECETHSGLHVVEENAIFESVGGELLLTSLTDLLQPTIQTRIGWSARIETEPCDCGRPGPRLIGLRDFLLPAKVAPKPDRLTAAANG